MTPCLFLLTQEAKKLAKKEEGLKKLQKNDAEKSEEEEDEAAVGLVNVRSFLVGESNCTTLHAKRHVFDVCLSPQDGLKDLTDQAMAVTTKLGENRSRFCQIFNRGSSRS